MEQDLNYIQAARIGHTEMLHAIFGKPAPEETPPVVQSETTDDAPPTAPKLTTSVFDQLFTDRATK